MELFNVHISKYRGGGVTAERLGGRGSPPALGMEARRGTPLGVIHDSPAESGVASTQRPQYERVKRAHQVPIADTAEVSIVICFNGAWRTWRAE